MDVYLIKWIDAFVIDKWASEEDMEEEFKTGLLIDSIGFLFKENDNYISLIQSFGTNKRIDCMLCIPKGCIIEKTKL